MDLGAVLLGSAIFIAAVPYVFSPLVRGPRQEKKGAKSQLSSGKAEKVDQKTERLSVLFELRDLEFDYQTGKVAEEDFLELRPTLLAHVAQLTSDDAQADEAIEQRIVERRRIQSSSGLVCAGCRGRLAPGDLFCPKCGANQKRGCSACGASLVEDARFCSHCGAPAAG